MTSRAAWTGGRAGRGAGRGSPVLGLSDTAVGLLLAVAVGVLYLSTITGGPAQVNDTRAASVAAWSLGTRGTVVLPETWPESHNYWGIEGRDGRVLVNRFPGVALWAAPAYALTAVADGRPPPAHPFLVDPAPARISAAVTAAGVVGVLFVLLRRLVSRPAALAGALVVATGTSLWSVAANEMWPHAPAMLALVAMVLAWRHRHSLAAAACAGVAVTVRPQLLVAVALLAGYAIWRERPRDGAWLAVGGVVGVLGVSAYTWWAFDTPLPVAGYDAPGHLHGLLAQAPWETARELGQALASPSRGVLATSPVLVPAVIATVAVRRRLPGWTLASAGVGLAYLVVQVRAAGHTGGQGFFAYRVSLEALALAAPALVAASVELSRRHRGWLVVIALLAAVSIGIHGWGAATGGMAEQTQHRWESIDITVREQYGDLRLGEVDLRR